MRETSERTAASSAAADLEKLADAPQVAQNLRNDIAGLSANMRDVVEKFDFDLFRKSSRGGSGIVQVQRHLDVQPVASPFDGLCPRGQALAGVDQPGGHLVAPAGYVAELVSPRSEDLGRESVVAVPALPAKREALSGTQAVGHCFGLVVGGSGDVHAAEQDLAPRGGARGAGGKGAHTEQAAQCTDDVSTMHGCSPRQG